MSAATIRPAVTDVASYSVVFRGKEIGAWSWPLASICC